MKKTILKSLGVILLSVICFGFTNNTNDITLDKITICHMPPGNTDNCHEITISVKALDTHMDHHGDRLICYHQQEFQEYVLIGIKTGLPVVAAF